MDAATRKTFEDLFEDYFKQIKSESNKYEKIYLINELLTRQHKLEAEGNSFWTTDYILVQLSKCI